MVSDESPTRPESQGSASHSHGGGHFRPPTIEEMNAALPQYEFVEMIGVGGMGAVYKARQPKLNRFVAIKILPPIPDDELGFAERFQREAQSMAQLSHPHIVPVYDFGETADGQLYFVMEYVEGADLHQLITGGQLTLDHFYGWIPQVCDAIQYAHDRGIVHRDIKPANILIDREGRVRIADFGLAKLIGIDQPQTALTLADLSMGTPDYASPEQMEASSEIDWRSDIYSLGVVMYQMLTGKLPRGAFPLPSEIDDDIDKRLDKVVLQAMQSEPSARFQSASAIATRLTEILHSPSAGVPIIEPQKKVSKPDLKAKPPESRNLLPIVAGVVAITVITGLFLASNRQKKRDVGQTKPAPVSHEPATKTPPKPKVVVSTEKPRPAETPKLRPEPRPENSERLPPRDFTRRQGGPGEMRPGTAAAFRDKLGRKPAQAGHLNVANLMILSRNGGMIEEEEPIAKVPKDLKPIVQLSIGQSPLQVDSQHRFAVALQGNGKLVAWGDNSENQTELPDKDGKFMAIAAGAAHALALRQDGTVIAWGDHSEGQCDVPEGLENVTAIAAGKNFSLALKSDGKVIAWGAPVIAEVPDALSENVTAISAGYNHAAALHQDGSVTTWGANDFGQLDQPEDLGTIREIACTFGNTYALRVDGSVVTWGASGLDNALPDAQIEEIYGVGDSLIARNRDGQLIIHTSKGKPMPLPNPMRQLSRDVRIAQAGSVAFAFRPVDLRLNLSEAGTPMEEKANDTLVVPTPPPVTLTEAGRAIAELQEKFELAYQDQVSLPWENSIKQLNDFYVNHLEERQAEAANAARLEDAVAWRTEAERVRAGEPLPETDDPSLLAGLVEIRRTYREKSAEYGEERKQAEQTLLTKYQEALKAMQDRFTEEQKLDDALEVKAFRESLL
ncbi:MAG: protein kinase [Verrucomicrobiae bacterium]|nr:protein kinase [Verrucomicrobiae bacterium]